MLFLALVAHDVLYPFIIRLLSRVYFEYWPTIR